MQGFIGELIGTFVLVLLGDGVVAGVSLNKSKAQDTGWLLITLGWGLAVTMGVYTSGFLSDAHLNPAITIAFAINGTFPWAEVIPYIAGQMIGAFLGAVVVWLNYFKHFEATPDPEAILGTFATGPAIRSTGWNLLSEIVGTAILAMGVMAMGPNNIVDGVGPIVVGIIVTSIGMSLGGTTGYAINPARDLGPRIAHQILPIANKGDSDWGYAWIPIVGPIIGATIAAVLYIMVL
ncbi:MIP/aquaporin family protein [Aerococcus kribbianus]|uniref:Aquaporin family protein n=1 Tax=Aerococcus kribbianus TaxID=2999064 RepID=A0A9X3JE82_9LACT|nr:MULTISPECIES: MIP/aquaporin family protein [unclassified Aerococcus]MCZ0716809.1 aquaporin family protein [Aerococcus sp. YH-aer221]MCZ0725097.1 aquaporin family protein [Aerococcus sp. YH-aer222]